MMKQRRVLLVNPTNTASLILFSCFSVLFSIVMTSLGEERAGLYESREFVSLSCMRYFLSFSLPLGVVGWSRWLVLFARDDQ